MILVRLSAILVKNWALCQNLSKNFKKLVLILPNSALTTIARKEADLLFEHMWYIYYLVRFKKDQAEI